MTYQRYAKRGRTVMRVTNPDLLENLDTVREEIKELLGCERFPGIQVCLDALMQWWLSCPPTERQEWATTIWKTPVVGYPNSERPNPGAFVSKKDEAAVQRARDGKATV